MIEQRYLRFTFFIIFCISIISGILSHFHIPYQFYVWELFVDSKILALSLLLFFLYRNNAFEISKIKLLLFRCSWKKNIIYFFSSLIFYGIVISIGLFFNVVSLNKMDNSTTLILATFFDIPAIFVFSVTSILIEEIFFRGYILSVAQQSRVQWHAVISTTVLWVMYSSSEIFGLEEVNAQVMLAIILFFFSIGIFCSVITYRYQSIWYGYSLRVGLITLSPIILTSILSETDAFFITDSSFFGAEGFIFSVLLLVTSFVLSRTFSAVPEIS